MKTSGWKRFGMLFGICLVLSMSNGTVSAAEEEAALVTGGLCEHHTEHNAECGYTEAVPESACDHEHTGECYEAIEKCVHEHDADCYEQKLVCEVTEEGHEHDADCYEDVLSCNHVCSEESGCITQELSCNHQHDNACGYQAAAEGTPCGYVCGECSAEEEAAAAQAVMIQAGTPENGIALMSSNRRIIVGYFFENDRFYWELDNYAILTVTGSGDIPVMAETDYPWKSYLYRMASPQYIAKVIIGKGITGVPSNAFCNIDSFTEVELADSVTSIGDNAFSKCEKLKMMEIPEGVESIGKEAFADCDNLETVVFKRKQAPSIGDDAFGGKTGITQIQIPEGATGYDTLINTLKQNNSQLKVVYTGGGSTSKDSSASSGKSSRRHHSSSGGSASEAKIVSAEDSRRAAQAARDASALALYAPAQYVMLQNGQFVAAAVRVGGTSDEMRTAFAAVCPAFGLTVTDTFAASVEGIDSAETVTIFLAAGSIPKDGILLAADAFGHLTLVRTETLTDGTIALTIPASCQAAVCTMAAASAS